MRALSIALLGLFLGSAPVLAFDCTTLTGATVPKSAIGLPTSGAVVASATLVSDPRNGTYCKLTGGVKPIDPTAPDIKFQINLPEHWNGRALQLGGGGFNGTVVTGEMGLFPDPAKPLPLKQGYVTFGSNSGHEGTIVDASFALNKEAFDNFNGAQIKKTHDVAMALVRRFFHAQPRHVYFAGGSRGGLEALIAAERWPADYNGIIAVHPAFDGTALTTARALDRNVVFAKTDGWVSPNKLATVFAKVLDRCDKLDGAKDGLIGNVTACRTAFDVASLRCSGGTDTGSDCLSDAQIASIRQLTTPTKLGMVLSGIDTIAPLPILESDADPGRTFFGTTSDPRSSFGGALTDQSARFMVMQDARYDVTKYDPASHSDRLLQLSREADVTGALVPFQRRGGKLLLMHGTSDMLIPPGNSVAFFERLQGAHGARLVGFARFYMAPGFGHGNGNFRVGWDSLAVLDTWVTKSKQPGPQVVTDTNTATLGRTRPLCEYPAYPKYTGSGDANVAASFTCVMP